jgi:hypothetical protein
MSPFDWFAAGMCVALGGQWLGMLLVAWERQRFYNNFRGRRMCPPKGSYSLPPDHDWRRSFNHENTAPDSSQERPRLWRDVQRGQGNGNGGPTTEKPAIATKPQFPPPQIIREDFLP